MRKLFEWLADLFTTKIGPNKTLNTDTIKNWLKTDQERKWSSKREEPNYFTSDDGKAIYVYESSIEYWEYISEEDNISEFAIPKDRAELFLMF